MKIAIGTTLLVLLAGSTTYAQEQEKEKPAQQEKKQEPAKEYPQGQQRDKPQEQPKAQQQQKEQQHQIQDQEKNQAKQVEKEKSDSAKQQQQAAKQQQQQQVARQDHANAQQGQRDGGNRNARRINEQDFHSHFGREHTFRVGRGEGRRFNYGGYYWVYNDPWPSGWAYSDDVYVDEIDGEYYLIDPVHPGLRLLIIIAD